VTIYLINYDIWGSYSYIAGLHFLDDTCSVRIYQSFRCGRQHTPEMSMFVDQSLWCHLPIDRIINYCVACMLLCWWHSIFWSQAGSCTVVISALDKAHLIYQRNLYLQKKTVTIADEDTEPKKVVRREVNKPASGKNAPKSKRSLAIFYM
jgi:hypothetical protein